jgi:hypothetical protein
MSNFKDFFVKEKPVFTGIARGVGGFAFGVSGIAEVSPSFTASGGAITLGSNSANGYTYHVFDQANSPETFEVTNAGDNEGYIEVLVVGGGGGGGGRGGGGGAGGVRYLTYQVTGTATMPVTVGAGSAGGTGHPGSRGTTGGNTVFVNPLEPETTTCGGGGGGGGAPPAGPAVGLSNANGSSGGMGRDGNAGPVASPDPAYGYPSGGAASDNNNGAGGGGGAGGSGARGNGPQTVMEGPGAGGYGVAYPGFGGSLISPPGSPNPRVPAPVRTAISSAGFYGAGGGGGSGGSTADPTASFRRMGIGGKGQRVDNGGTQTPDNFDGIDLTGSGGGGGSDSSPHAGGTGGDGVVIVRYRKRGDGSDDVGTVSGSGGSRNVKAVGGVIEFTSTKTIHYFLQPGSFTVNTAITGANVLVVGGGGSGGDRHGGGGGAGGVVHGPSVSLPAATYPVVIGAGGVQSMQAVNSKGTNGIDSSFGPPASVNATTHFQAPGGGGGGGYAAPIGPGRAGGSGGGGGGQSPSPAGSSSSGFTPAGSPHPLPFGTVIRYGSAGGAGTSGSPDFRNGGGGGGATQTGASNPGPNPAGNGGNGISVTFGGNPYTWAGGGGGGRWNAFPTRADGGTGGPGGGAAGGSNGPGETGGSGDPIVPGGPGHWLAPHFPSPSQDGGGQIGSPSRGGDAVFGTGGGGGGQGQGLPYSPTNPTGTGGSGAPGIVIIEYPS